MKVAIIGAGPVGALMSIALANRGFKVDLFEARKDSRILNKYEGRSINLALSCRGKNALEKYGITISGVNMVQRCIHPQHGSFYNQSYGPYGESITSISRRTINETILNKADQHRNINIFFESECQNVNIYKKEITINNTIYKDYEFIIGADGVNSRVRHGLLAQSNITYKRSVIDHSYKEMYIGPNLLPTDSLHIWPLSDFMMIALPNLDNSFTVTLFMPTKNFELLDSEFINTKFPSVAPLLDMCSANPVSSLNTVSVYPWHYKDWVVLIGDAAHAMVPFYGQGLNCSLEDVIELGELFDLYGFDTQTIFEKFSLNRSKDTNAISEMSYQNYIEMRSSVISEDYIKRMNIERMLVLKPKLQRHLKLSYPFMSKYSMVAFSNIPYSEVIRRDIEQQAQIDKKMSKIIHDINMFAKL